MSDQFPQPERMLALLEAHNQWRRGVDCIDMQDPKQIGEAIDWAVDHIKRTQSTLRTIKLTAEQNSGDEWRQVATWCRYLLREAADAD